MGTQKNTCWSRAYCDHFSCPPGNIRFPQRERKVVTVSSDQHKNWVAQKKENTREQRTSTRPLPITISQEVFLAS
jgi:hypothetical protein